VVNRSDAVEPKRARTHSSVPAAAGLWAGTSQLLSLLNGVAPSTVQDLASAATTSELPRGAPIYAAGDKCTGLHVVLIGRVKLTLPLSKSAPKVVALLGPSSWFGEGALFLHERHATGASAVERTALAHIPAVVVLHCLKNDSAFAVRMLAETSRRLRIPMFESATASSPARRRVIGFLLDELVKTQASKGSAEIVLPAVKRTIASRLSISGEHLSRVLRELRLERLIRVDGPQIFVRSVARLRDAYSAADGSRRQAR